MNYGLPYKGSKSGICKWLMEYIPMCDVFVDVFSGGCAVTHAMMLENKAKRYILNDLNVGVAELFIDALSGKLDDKYDINKFVSKDEFFGKKKDNAFIRCAWSFGNDNDSYMYSKDSEIYRRACHNVIIDDEWFLFEKICPEIYRDVFARMCGKVYDDRKDKRIELGKCIASSLKELIIKDIPLLNYAINKNHLYKQYIPYLKGNKIGMHISPTPHLERIERLEKIKNKDHFLFDISHCDYKELEIADGSCVYCDPPYRGTTGYEEQINYEEFYDWCYYLKYNKDCNVFISEYEINDDRFVCIAEKEKRVSVNDKKTTVRTERLYRVR